MIKATEKRALGFTLIEMMLVVAIIGLLAIIALPAYNRTVTNSANGACLGEARAYIATGTLFAITEGRMPDPYNANACQSMSPNPITDFEVVTFTPAGRGDTNTICDLTAGGGCRLDN